MTSITNSLRHACRRVFGDTPHHPQRSLQRGVQQSAIAGFFGRCLTTSAAFRQTSDETRDTSTSEPPSWSDRKTKTRFVPVSPSYFTGSAEYVDNLLSLQELLRRYETLPVVPRDQAPRARWMTLVQYGSAISGRIKASKYKKIVSILGRLNCIEPSLLPEEVKSALDMCRRPVEAGAAEMEPKSLDNLGRAYGLGRRKTSVAKVYALEGDGQFLVNGKPLAQAFERVHDRESALWPLIATGRTDKYNVWSIVSGGGKTGQAEAITLGLGRALLVHEPALKPALRRARCLTRDPRMVERKKPGHLKARKMPTWVKR